MIRRPSVIRRSLTTYPLVCPSMWYNWVSSSRWQTLGQVQDRSHSTGAWLGKQTGLHHISLRTSLKEILGKHPITGIYPIFIHLPNIYLDWELKLFSDFKNQIPRTKGLLILRPSAFTMANVKLVHIDINAGAVCLKQALQFGQFNQIDQTCLCCFFHIKFEYHKRLNQKMFCHLHSQE